LLNNVEKMEFLYPTCGM